MSVKYTEVFGPKAQPFIQRRAQPWYRERVLIILYLRQGPAQRAKSSSSIPYVSFVNLDTVLLADGAEFVLKRRLPMVFSLAVNVSDNILNH